jgi:GH15 family glucan-1,4-alpha-glucosidase
LDEACGPAIAVRDYFKRTNDKAFIEKYSSQIGVLESKLMARYEAETGLFNTQEDSQDNYIKERFFTYANALTWKALLALADLREALGEGQAAEKLKSLAARLKEGILKYCVAAGAPGAEGPIFARNTDLKNYVFNDVPPGSLIKLPLIGLIPEDNPVFTRTWDWLHSKNYSYSQAGQPYGLPASFRVPFTCCWVVGEHLRLKQGREMALKILKKATWDYGIVSEGLDARNAEGLGGGGAFAAAAGYLAHCIWEAHKK